MTSDDFFIENKNCEMQFLCSFYEDIFRFSEEINFEDINATLGCVCLSITKSNFNIILL